MKYTIAMIFCILFGMAEAGEIFKKVIANGMIATSPTSEAFYQQIAENGGVIENAIVLLQKDDAGQYKSEIALHPLTAEKIAKEAEPYIMLHERGKIIDEAIAINDTVSLSIKSDRELRITVKARINDNEREVVFVDNAAIDFINGCSDATRISAIWTTAIFSNMQKSTPRQIPVQSNAIGDLDDGGVIRLQAIQQEYSANEIAATQKYDQCKGKSIIASGTIRSISMDRDTRLPRVLFDESIKFFSISCTVSDPESIKKAASLQPGQQITVEGIWRGPNAALQATIYDARIVE